jgi:threonine dehydrogenase-like Zn-dependent dehydrogenase
VRAVLVGSVGDRPSVVVVDVAEPRIEDPRDALVRVTRSAICGSDLHALHGKLPMEPGEMLGHEGVGVLEEVGPDVTRFRPGDRVAVAFDNVCGECWYCSRGESSLCSGLRNLGLGAAGGGLGGMQAELVRVPRADANLLPIPDEVDDEHALFIGDVLTTGYYGVALARPEPGESVAVVGCGPVGFFAVQAARVLGADPVVGIDPVPGRLDLVREQGARPVNPSEGDLKAAVREATGGRGVDVAVEAVGSLAGFEAARTVVRRGGRISVVGVYGDDTLEVRMNEYWIRGLKLLFAGICPVHGWWERAMDAVRAGDIDPVPLISHRLPLEEAAEGYELFGRRVATKVVLVP